MAEPIKAPRGRPARRESVSVRNRLNVEGTDPNYVYRIVADVSDRLDYMEKLGYEFVKAKDVKVGGKRMSQPQAAEGENAQISLGGGIKGYVMRISKEWYEQDQSEKRASIDETRRALGQIGDYGDIRFGKSQL